MAEFNFREEFADNIQQLDDLFGSPAAANGAPDVANATEAILTKIAAEIEAAKDNPERLKELQSLALSVTETYFTSTGEKGGNNDVKNLSAYIQNQLKTILGENAAIETKSPELNAKLKEITSPEQTADTENNTIRLETNARGQAEYNALSSNEQRRQFVFEEFHNGVFTDKSHIDFFLEQYGKGEIILADADKNKLQALARGIEGYKGLAEVSQELADRMVKASLQYSSSNYYGGIESMADPNLLQTKTTDLGLEDVLKNIDKTKARDDFDNLIIAVRKQSLKNKLYGADAREYEPLKDKLNNQKLKWYQLRRKYRLNKAKREIDPNHWGNRKNNASWFGSRGYFAVRNYLANRPDKIFQKSRERLNRTIELRNDAESTKWFSKEFGTKLKSKFLLAWRKATFRGEGFLTRRIVNNATVFQLDGIKREMSERISNLSSGATKAQQRGIDAQKQIMQNLINRADKRTKTLTDRFNAFSTALDDKAQANEAPKMQKFRNRLDAMVKDLQEQHGEALKKNPLYMAMAAAGLKMPENAKAKITAESVLDNILKQYPEEKREEIKKTLGYIKDEEERPAESRQGNETEEVQTTQEQASVGNVIEPGKGGNLPGYVAEDDTQRKEGDKTLFSVAEDKSRYDLVTTDKEGKPRDPSDAEIKAMVAQLKGVKEVTLENSFSPETQLKLMDELNEQGIGIANRDEVIKRLTEAQEKGQTGTPKEGEATKEATNNTASVRETENMTDRKMSIEKVMIAAVSSSKDEKEQTERLKLIERIQNGEAVKDVESFNDLKGVYKEINQIFGKGSKEAIFLSEMVTARSLEKEDDYNEKDFKEDKAKIGLRDKHDADRMTKVSAVINLADKFKGKDIKELEQDETYKSLHNKYAQKGVRALIELDAKTEISPEARTAARNRILSGIIEGKYRPSKQAQTQTQSSQRTVSQTRGDSNGY